MDEGMERKKKQNENKQAEAQKEAFRSVACCGVTDTCDNTVRSGCSSSLIIDLFALHETQLNRLNTVIAACVRSSKQPDCQTEMLMLGQFCKSVCLETCWCI